MSFMRWNSTLLPRLYIKLFACTQVFSIFCQIPSTLCSWFSSFLQISSSPSLTFTVSQLMLVLSLSIGILFQNSYARTMWIMVLKHKLNDVIWSDAMHQKFCILQTQQTGKWVNATSFLCLHKRSKLKLSATLALIHAICHVFQWKFNFSRFFSLLQRTDRDYQC